MNIAMSCFWIRIPVKCVVKRMYSESEFKFDENNIAEYCSFKAQYKCIVVKQHTSG